MKFIHRSILVAKSASGRIVSLLAGLLIFHGGSLLLRAADQVEVYVIVSKPEGDSTPAHVLTPCSPSSTITILLKSTNQCFSYLVTNWALPSENWNFQYANPTWVHFGSKDEECWLEYPGAGSTNGYSDTITRSFDAKERTMEVTATIWYTLYFPDPTPHTERFQITRKESFEIRNENDCACSGGSGGGGTGDGSGSSGSVPTFGTGNLANNRGPDLSFSFGMLSYSQDAGALKMVGRVPSGNLSKPDSLYVPYLRPGVDVVTNGTGVIQQVRPPQGLIHVAVVNNYKYQLQTFYDVNVTPKVGGLYGTNGPAFVTWTIENPDGSTNNSRLKITESRPNLADRLFTYAQTNDSGIGKWELTDGQGIRTEVSWEQQDGVQSSWTNIFQVIKSGGTVVQKTQKTYVMLNGQKMLNRVIEGDGAVTQTTTYTYNAANQVQRIDYPDGNWEEFTYDGSSRVSSRYTPHGDSPGLSGRYKLTSYDYALEVPGDNPNLQPNLARLETIGVLDQSMIYREISRTYRSVPNPGEVHEWRCPAPSALWDDANNLHTVTLYYVDTSDVNTRGRMKWQVRPDGTATIYNYQTNSSGVLTNIAVKTGEPNDTVNPTNILNGIMTESALDSFARSTNTTTKSIANSTNLVVLAQVKRIYAGNLGEDQEAVDLANRTNEFHYACCGLDSTVDPDRVSTLYESDYLRRQVATIRFFDGSAGIKTTNVLDAAGRVLATQRIGTNGASVITLGQSEYDVLGRVIKRTNVLNGVTTYSESVVSNKLQRTTTNPDGGTRTETYYRDGRLEKVTGTAAFGTRYVYDVELDGSYYRESTKELKLDGSGSDTSEWVKTYVDGAGNSYKTVFADNSYEQSYVNNKGQLWKQRDADGVITLYEYNHKGERVTTALDLDQDSVVDRGVAGSKDRVSDTVDVVTNYSGSDVIQIENWVFTTDSSATTNLVSISRTSADGLKTWRTVYKDQSTAVTTSTVTQYGNATRTNTVTNPDGSSVVSIYSYGRLSSLAQKDSSGGQVTKTTYSYDVHGRVLSTTDARNGATGYTYNAADQPETVTTPAPGDGSPGQPTTTYYDTSLRAWKVVQPDGTSVTNEYYVTGLLKWTYGSRTYPVQYAYNPQGRMTSMKTYQSFSGDPNSPGTAAETTWVYDTLRGWLVKKIHPGETDTTDDYTYTAGSRLKTRVWERSITTTYKYGFDDTPTDNQHGDLVEISYTDGTPTTSYTYDRRGRRATASRNSITTTSTYNDADQLLTESYSGGTLAGLSVNNVYDNYLRHTTTEIKNGSTVLQGVSYAYDTAGRLQTVTDASATSYTANYAYHVNSPLVNTLTFKENTTSRLVTTRTYDLINRLTLISSAPAGSGAPSLPISFLYQHNTANQRRRATLGDGSYWVYSYDKLGQVISGNKYWSDGTPVAGQQFEYTFDDIGNRDKTSGRASAVSDYTANALNQYTSRTVSGVVDVTGVANPTAGVTVNGNTASRRGDYFHWPLTVANSSAQYPTITVVSQYGSTQTDSGEVFVPASTESYSYDTDGNLTSDGRWTYIWDGENRLVEMKRDTSVPTLSSRLRVTFEYDHQGRRIRKTFYTHNGSAWVEQTDTVFLYDGWNLMGELDANASNAKLRTYIWGLDLSGSNQGAGGVGGLLKVTDYTSGTTHHFVAYDGNGNVAALIDGSTGAATARYEYGPFGEPVRTTGALAKKNPLRFSTKYTDDESGLLYYGFRYYNPSTGRWLSRDPIEERGGLNLCGFAANDPIRRVDRLGTQQLPPEEPVTSVDLTPLECGKCGVESLRLEIVGVTVFVGDPSDATLRAGYEFPMKRTVKLKRGGKYNPKCCLVFQQQKSKVVYNGVPQTQSSNGSPLDGNWHLDPPYFWSGDTPGVAAGVPDGESWDHPGIYGLKTADVILETSSYRLVAIDTCRGNRVVKRSNTAKYRASGTWPSLDYHYSN